MLDFVKPISGNHSISRVQATVFIPQIFLKPDDVFEKLKKIDGFNNYQRKTITKSTTINFDQGKGTLGIQNNDKRGFVFEEFVDGRLKNSIRFDNVSDKQSIIQFESRIYDGWVSFRDRFLKDLKLVLEVSDYYLEAISINYIDEFLWENPDHEIDVECIFNKNSELLNKKFLSSKNGTLVLISQDEKKGKKSEERTEITFNNVIKRIIINHHYAIRFNEYNTLSSLMKNNNLSGKFDVAHVGNKNMLKTILTNECQLKIGVI